MKHLALICILILAGCGKATKTFQLPTDLHGSIPIPTPAPAGVIAVPALGCSNLAIDFSNLHYPNAAQTKTYVMFDLNPDGTWTNVGNGGNGNVGNSAQIGADCCRPAADQGIGISIPPDSNAHQFGLYALGAGTPGYSYPFIIFTVPAETRADCQASFVAPAVALRGRLTLSVLVGYHAGDVQR